MKQKDKNTLRNALFDVTSTNNTDFERGINYACGVITAIVNVMPTEPDDAKKPEMKATVTIASHEPAVFGEWYKPPKLPEYGKLVLVEPETGKTCTGYVRRYDNSDRWYDHVGNGIGIKRWCELPVQEEGLPF